jgi:hypothetical protein
VPLCPLRGGESVSRAHRFTGPHAALAEESGVSDREFYGAFFVFGAWLLALCLLIPLEMRGRNIAFFAVILSALCAAVAVAILA